MWRQVENMNWWLSTENIWTLTVITWQRKAPITTTGFLCSYMVVGAESVGRSLVELCVFVWLEVVVMIAALLFSCLNQQKTLLVKTQWECEAATVLCETPVLPQHCVMLSDIFIVELDLLIFVFQKKFSDWWLWIHAFLLLSYDAVREERVVLKRTQWMAHKCEVSQLIYSHNNLYLLAEGVWVVYDWLWLDLADELADLADITV